MSDLFETPEQGNENQTPATPAANDYSSLLSGITNESGEQKYKTVETAIQSLGASQTHIKELEERDTAKATEIAELKAQLAAQATTEEVLRRIQEQKAPEVPVSTPAPAGLNTQDVQGLFENMIAQREQATIVEANKRKLVSGLTDRFGDKAQDAFHNKAKEMGISVSELDQLALKSPEFVLKQFAVTPSVQPTTSSLSGTTFGNNVEPDSLGAPDQSVWRPGNTTNDQITEWRRHAEHIKNKYK